MPDPKEARDTGQSMGLQGVGTLEGRLSCAAGGLSRCLPHRPSHGFAARRLQAGYDMPYGACAVGSNGAGVPSTETDVLNQGGRCVRHPPHTV
ncbi:hypothetical protein [Comamonas odontotermitis]|uniref:hypothetical protein n=1 Tax=Comamonas odontotermitis TaxID=379895 RepID=UPI001CC48EA1|nr:hypothetical protein [Comamonas odontotermitis]UBB16412.1 hypothetical protein LAD35_16585 [Comamonas odontotermitis]